MAEALFALGILLSAVVLNIELIRRVEKEIFVRHAAFFAARMAALQTKGANTPKTRTKLREMLRRGLGTRESERVMQSIDAPRELENGKVRAYLRYSSLISFPKKHHFEITHLCRFPF